MDIERIKTDLSEKYPPFSDLLQRDKARRMTYVVSAPEKEGEKAKES